MARIRTVKPDLWEDEVVGLLSFGSRLLFIATFNLADDEGLLRWTPDYIKASVFMYDANVLAKQVDGFMKELSTAGLILPYLGGRSQQKLGWIVNFHRHQRINRPQPSKLPAPSLQNLEVRQTYGRRDKMVCHLCRRLIDEAPARPDGLNGWNDSLALSMDHVIPQSHGGTDHPSNIRAAHQSCNKSRCNRPIESFTEPQIVSHMNPSRADSVNDSVNDSLPEGNGREVEGNREVEQGMDLDAQVHEIAGFHPKVHDRFNLSRVVAEAIARAIARDGWELVWAGTKCMAEAVGKWPVNERRFLSAPENFFNKSEYRADPAEWERSNGTNGNGKPVAKADLVQQQIIDARNEARRAVGLDH